MEKWHAKSFVVLLVLALTGSNLPAVGAEPEGPVVLTVHGAADGDVVAFDFETLEALGTATLETDTTFTDGTQVFEGVPLATVLNAVGIEGETVTARALNDYEVDISMDIAGELLLATRMNGERMSVRDRGPIWIVYDHNGRSKETIDGMDYYSVWQLDELIVR